MESGDFIQLYERRVLKLRRNFRELTVFYRSERWLFLIDLWKAATSPVQRETSLTEVHRLLPNWWKRNERGKTGARETSKKKRVQEKRARRNGRRQTLRKVEVDSSCAFSWPSLSFFGADKSASVCVQDLRFTSRISSPWSSFRIGRVLH